MCGPNNASIYFKISSGYIKAGYKNESISAERTSVAQLYQQHCLSFRVHIRAKAERSGVINANVMH